MPDPLRLFILAGESSGDRLGADLVSRLAERTPIALSGVGGRHLEAHGLRSLFPMEELSVMGWADVLPRLPRLLWRARQVASAIARTNPDVVVLVDAQVFSSIVARGARRRGYARPLVLYVAPAVWAWKPERAVALNRLFDEVFAVLPFEPAVMTRFGGPPTSYVGHPALARFVLRDQQPERGPLLLLPGSRAGELRRHLPVMREVAERVARHPRISEFLLPTPAVHRARLAAETAGWSVPVRVIADEAEVQAGFSEALAAVAVTGTVTLELALAGVPMVTTYVADKGQAKLWANYAAKFASLPNILLNRALVPEMLGLDAQPGPLGEALDALLGPGGMDTQLGGFREIRRVMEEGVPDAPPDDPATRVLSLAQRSSTAT